MHLVQSTGQFQHEQMKLANVMTPATMATIVSSSGGAPASSSAPTYKAGDDSAALMNAVKLAVQKSKQLTLTEIKK